jgi:hypothetical protein
MKSLLFKGALALLPLSSSAFPFVAQEVAIQLSRSRDIESLSKQREPFSLILFHS